MKTLTLTFLWTSSSAGCSLWPVNRGQIRRSWCSCTRLCLQKGWKKSCFWKISLCVYTHFVILCAYFLPKTWSELSTHKKSEARLLSKNSFDPFYSSRFDSGSRRPSHCSCAFWCEDKTDAVLSVIKSAWEALQSSLCLLLKGWSLKEKGKKQNMSGRLPRHPILLLIPSLRRGWGLMFSFALSSEHLCPVLE